MSEPAAPYAPACPPADSHQTSHKPRRCFDHDCLVREACPLWQRRHGPVYGPVAGTWRHGWECTGERCAVARGEMGQGGERDNQPESGHEPEVVTC